MREEFRVVGKSVPKKDSLAKVTGKLRYTGDISLPNMLYAKILRSPHAHAKVKTIDLSKAERLPGVKGIITFKDVPKKKFNPWLDTHHEVEPRDRLILTDKPLYYGDGICAVAAETEEIAERALEEIRVEYEVLPAVLDPFEAMKPNMPRLHDSVEMNIGSVLDMEEGDVKKGFEDVDVIVEDSFKTQRELHQCMENNSCLAYYDDTRNELVLYTTTQNPHPMKSRLAYALDLTMPVRVITPLVGGAFGQKHDLFQHDGVACSLALKTRKPVKCVLSREEVSTLNRMTNLYIDIKLGVKKNGKFISLDEKIIADMGAYGGASPAVAYVAFQLPTFTKYRIPNYKLSVKGVYTNTSPCTPLRGFGNPQGTFAFEQIVDEVAEKLGMDPVELRLINLTKAGDPIFGGLKLSSSAAEECLTAGSKAIGWNMRNKLPKEGVKKRGIGVGLGNHYSGTYNLGVWSETTSVIFTIDIQGKGKITTATVDIGQGIRTTLPQIAAEASGLSYENIDIDFGTDTSTQPFDWGSFGSRSLFVLGAAVKEAATKAKNELLRRMAKREKVDPKDLDIKDSKIYNTRTNELLFSVEDAVYWATALSDEPGQIFAAVNYVVKQNPLAFNSQFAEVEVDTETGQVSIIKLVSVLDAGTAINPAIVIGQAVGSVVDGIGYSLLEEEKYHPNTGKNLSLNFSKYIIPRSTDIPDMETILLDTYDPVGPYGAKGIGELGRNASAAAIANAIYDAIGIRIKEIPITPDRLLKEISQKH